MPISSWVYQVPWVSRGASTVMYGAIFGAYSFGNLCQFLSTTNCQIHNMLVLWRTWFVFRHFLRLSGPLGILCVTEHWTRRWSSLGPTSFPCKEEKLALLRKSKHCSSWISLALACCPFFSLFGRRRACNFFDSCDVKNSIPAWLFFLVEILAWHWLIGNCAMLVLKRLELALASQTH